jgi:Mn-dependent DtxR family transcriptional regulator
MPVPRRAVLDQLAAESDATAQETTTVVTLAATLEIDERAVEAHLQGLAACELARIDADGNARVTITGEELLELGTDEVVIVDTAGRAPGR